MGKSKKLTYKEMIAMLRDFNNMNVEMKEAIAACNNCTADELKMALESVCYAVENLGINQIKTLRKEIDTISAEDIKAIERVNDSSIDKIVYAIDTKINDYENVMKKQRAFNKAWKIRQAEVQQQLVDEGIDKVDAHGFLNINFMEHQKRMAEAQMALATEMGLHFTKYDPFIGVIEI